MALDKAIEHGKEKRKPYMKYCEQVDKTCRPHGGCPYCESNRLHNRVKKETHAKMDMEETKFEEGDRFMIEKICKNCRWWVAEDDNGNYKHEEAIKNNCGFCLIMDLFTMKDFNDSCLDFIQDQT